MSSRLLNVRLDEVRVRKVRRLRETGVALSDLVREAIDARYDAMARPMAPQQAKAAIARIFAQHPDPPDLPARDYDVHDRRAARTAIQRSFRRRPR